MKKIHITEEFADFLERGRFTKDDLLYWVKKLKAYLSASCISLEEFFLTPSDMVPIYI